MAEAVAGAGIKRRKPRGLALKVTETESDRGERVEQAGGAMGERKESFKLGDGSFEAGDMRIDKSGLHVGDSSTAEGDEEEIGDERAVTFEELEIVGDLGSGASSTVKLARHKVTGERYALKCIGLYVKQMRKQLMSELRTLFSSDCDCLVGFHGATYREGQVAVVLEYMDLGGLDGIVRHAGHIPERVLAAICFQVCWALGYLAVERRVHRDIKPQNILVNSHGEVKLTDFGLSKEISTAVLAKTFVGTMKYLSPERMLSQPYGYSSDIWSLGLVLHECATGSFPYPDANSTIAIVTIVTDGEPPLPPRDGTYSNEFVDLLEMCLKKDPTERATAVQVLESEWMAMHGATSLEECQDVVKAWLDEQGLSKQ